MVVFSSLVVLTLSSYYTV